MIAIHDRFERRIYQLKWVIGVGFFVSVLASIVSGYLHF